MNAIALEFFEIYAKHATKFIEETQGSTNTAKIKAVYADSLHVYLRLFYSRFRIAEAFDAELQENNITLNFSDKLGLSKHETLNFLGSIYVRAKDTCKEIFNVEFTVPVEHSLHWERRITQLNASVPVRGQ